VVDCAVDSELRVARRRGIPLRQLAHARSIIALRLLASSTRTGSSSRAC